MDFIGIILAALALVIGFVIGFSYRKKIAEAKIGGAEKKANAIIDEVRFCSVFVPLRSILKFSLIYVFCF